MSKFKIELSIVIIIATLIGIRVGYLESEHQKHLEKCGEIVYKRTVMRNVTHTYKSCNHY